MGILEKFIGKIVPGNYFLTKSMEFTRISSSGTLWYLKKYLVLYNSIFLSDEIKTGEGVKRIVNIFEKYINSLPIEVRDDANNFFFPEEANLKGNYNRFNMFFGNPHFQNKRERISYEENAKKYYFAYLMLIGGQSGVKAFIKEQLYSENFCISEIDIIIDRYKSEHPECTDSTNAIRNDYHASLRNERQILFYYGFVHSKSNGSVDREFSSLTPVGELAVEANAKELEVIWEHQKIKMVSQPVTVDIGNINGNEYANHLFFSINYNPYISILKCLWLTKEIDKEFYKFVVSRTDNKTIEDVEKNITEFETKIDTIKNFVNKFHRASDIKNNDYEKELKKYLIGIRSDIPKDKNTNNYSFCELNDQKLILTNENVLNKILYIYDMLAEYKLNNKKYLDIFKRGENELVTKYMHEVIMEEYEVNPKVKIFWDLYNINLDAVIILSVIISKYAVEHDKNFNDIQMSKIIDYIREYYQNILLELGLKSKDNLLKILKNIIDGIINKTLSDINLDDIDYEKYYENDYSSLNSEDLIVKIKEISNSNLSGLKERVRDMNLISLIKNYYLINYSDNQHLVKCDYCGNETFITKNGDAYLEFHHILPFKGVDGPDHYLNICGICPNCHRKIHHGNDSCKNVVFDSFNVNNHFHKAVFERLKEMYELKGIKSYHLEYALAENMITEEEYNSLFNN